jgi:hypothetical protein
VEKDQIGRTCSTHEEVRNAHKILVGKPEGKRPLGSLGSGWEGNVEMGHKEKERNFLTN